jgi:hypothetical protein
MRHIIPISGKDSCATAILQTAYKPNIEYEYIFNPTGLEIPPVYQWLDKVSDYLGKSIKYIGKPLDKIIQEQKILPSQQMRFCTKYAKIFPLRDYLSTSESTVYYGLRFDEPNREGHNGMGRITPKFPLRKFQFGINQVWSLVEKKGLLPPFLFWESVYEEVKKRIPHYHFTVVDTLEPWDYQNLFSWRSRQFNCCICIYMRLYEFVGCYEHYPEIYRDWIEIEKEYGSKSFGFKKDWPLERIIKNADKIREKRIDQICKIIYKLCQKSIFEDHKDLLSTTSCGLFCGK